MSEENVKKQDKEQALPVVTPNKDAPQQPEKVPEVGGPKGPEPTRYGDWERGGRCIDF